MRHRKIQTSLPFPSDYKLISKDSADACVWRDPKRNDTVLQKPILFVYYWNTHKRPRSTSSTERVATVTHWSTLEPHWREDAVVGDPKLRPPPPGHVRVFLWWQAVEGSGGRIAYRVDTGGGGALQGCGGAGRKKGAGEKTHTLPKAVHHSAWRACGLHLVGLRLQAGLDP